MSTGHVLLGLLTHGPRHGYQLKRGHDERFPAAKPLAYGQVYAVLQRLSRDGLVEVVDTVKEGGPERTVYAITEAGQAELTQWLHAVEPPAPYVAAALHTRVVLALLVGGPAEDCLERQRARHLDRMRELTRRKADIGASTAEIVAADYALAHLDADLRWIEATRERLADLGLEVQK
jgi:DNA-binding PadR family transcriptional regulator